MIFKICPKEGLKGSEMPSSYIKEITVLANVGVRMLYLNAGFLSAGLGPK